MCGAPKKALPPINGTTPSRMEFFFHPPVTRVGSHRPSRIDQELEKNAAHLHIYALNGQQNPYVPEGDEAEG